MRLRTEEAKAKGRGARSIYENPYWLSYPGRSTEEEESCGRFFVEGYVEELRERSG